MTSCPQCAHQLVGGQGFVSWCEHCDWNVDPLSVVPAEATPGERAAVQRAHSLYQQVLRDGPERAPRTGASLALLALALPVLVFHGAAFAVGAWVVATSATWWWKLIVGVPLMLLGLVVVLPPPRNRRQRVVRVAAPEHPDLFELVAQLCQAVGAARPRRVVVTDQWRIIATSARGRVLEIGLPLWAALAPDERRALLARELCAYGRVRRSRQRFNDVCVQVVGLWRDAFRLDYGNRRVSHATPQMRAEWRIAGDLNSQRVTHRRMLFRWPLEVWSRLIARVTEHDAWCAAYVADLTAARVVSADALGRALAVAYAAQPRYEARVSRWSQNPVADEWWVAISGLAAGVPATEQRRWRRAAQRADHPEPYAETPPCGWRLAVLAGAPSEQSRSGAATASIGAMRAIDDALALPASALASMLVAGGG